MRLKTVQSDDDKVATRKRQADSAIQLAMSNRWEEAVQANRAILSLFPNDGDSYNRLGKALMELGRYSEAKKAYKKALELDPTNQIAKKNLERLNALVKTGAAQAATTQVDPKLFIEEMGKSALTQLQQTSPDLLTALNAGERVDLKPEKNKLAAETPGGEFVGLVEPKLAARLLKLIEGGNQYAAAITSVDTKECRIIIKETFQHPSQAGRPSFPSVISTEGTRPYTKESLLRYGTQVEELERSDGDDDAEQEGDARPWDSENVIQEGHVRLNDAAAAEDVDDELEE
ncbi:MAG: tetratricopeptide repeat protein [Dehalococcoidia bacterium]|nr:tetratricopeptide repeat protein [Dehalococcoidia bacterium]